LVLRFEGIDFKTVFFLIVLGFELRDSTAWAVSPSLFCLGYFWGSHFMPRPVWTMILLFNLILLLSLLFYTSHIAGMTGTHHHTHPLVEMGSCKLLPTLASNFDPPNLCLPRSWQWATAPGLKLQTFMSNFMKWLVVNNK
jgi:hypothetical protein